MTDPSLHGADGPIRERTLHRHGAGRPLLTWWSADYSYPGFFYPQVANWIPTLANLGIETRDPAGGESWGAFIATSAIDPDGWKRSYSKTGTRALISLKAYIVVD